jgi:hypothetical protein
MKIVLVATAAGASPVTPLAPPSASPLEGLDGEGMGDGIPRGVLRLVPEGSTLTELEAGGAAGELAVIGSAVVAAAGSGLLVCLTASAAANGAETPIDIADEYYGTHFGDVPGWVQGQYPSQASKIQSRPRTTPRAPPSASPSPKPSHDEEEKPKLGRIYVTYTKVNKITKRYYSGRTSMVVDLSQRRDLQEAAAVLLRDQNHHTDEKVEPKSTVFTNAFVDESDVGTAIDYAQRYDDIAYWRIRGREQQLIDYHGGAQSDTGEPYQTENAVRGVAKDNKLGRRFHDASNELWPELHPYTGY